MAIKLPRWPRAFIAWIACSVLATPGSLQAEHRNTRFERVVLSESASQAVVYSIHQERSGVMWLGTAEGLIRFDGYSASSFTHDPDDPGSLAHDNVRAVFEDDEGRLWVGTAGGGLSLLDRSAGSFTHFRHDPGDDTTLSSDLIRAIKANGPHGLWIGTDGAGLNHFDPREGTFRRIPYGREAGDSLLDGHVRSLLRDREGFLWIGTDKGLSRLDPDSGRFAHFAEGSKKALGFQGQRVRALLEDENGDIWAGTDDGLNRFDRSMDRFVHYAHDPREPQSLSASAVWKLFQDRKGTIWVGTATGLDEWLPETSAFEHYRHDPANPYSLQQGRVVAIFEDAGGVLWVGTLSGLDKWNPITGAFQHIQADGRESSDLTHGYVTSFAQRSTGELWVGTFGGGVNVLQLKDHSTERIRQYEKLVPVSERITAVLATGEETIWLGTFGGEVLRIYPEEGRVESVLQVDGNVTSLLEGRNRSVWVGTYGDGLRRVDFRGRVDSFRVKNGTGRGLNSDRVMSLFGDSTGNLWVGTRGGGLHLLRAGSDQFESFRHEATNLSSLSNDYAWTVAEDRLGNLWVGTEGGGLNRWSAADRAAGRVSFSRFGRKSGLLSSTIYGIVPGDENELWLSTNAGLARFDFQTERFKHFDTSHGLQSNEFNFGAAYRGTDGMLFFGGVSGFNAFYPSEIRGNQHVPPVVLTSFSKFNKPVEFDRPLSEIDQIDLSYKDSVISFEFAALDFTAPHKNKYRYKLVGFDHDWVEAGTRRRATYTNLAAGHYTFRVQGSNNDGVWNTDGVSMSLTVGPHPLQSKVAYGIYLLMAFGAIAGYSRVQARKREHAAFLARTNEALITEVAQRKEKERALEQERRRAQRYLDVAEVIMLVVDEDGRVQLINPKGCRVLGRDRREVIGRSWVDDFVRRKDQSKAGRSLVESGGYWEYSVRDRQGDERIVAWHTAPLYSDDGRRTGTLCSGADVTEERRLAEEKAIAESASQAKSQFLANMSHEIRTPLNGVLGMIELLNNSGLDERQRRLAETAGLSARNLMSILNDILDFSKIEAGKLALEWVDFDLRQVVEEVCVLFSEAAHQKELELVHAVPPAFPTALIGDPTRLRQILSNLIGNAIKFTSEGTVVVAVEAVRTSEDWLDLRCEVRDSGVGLEGDAIERVFDSFSQADESTTRKFGGTGLGLAISKQLVDLLDGEIGVDSQPGAGSTFWFTVRFARQGAEESRELERFGPPAPRVLVVEDNPVSREVLEEQLLRWGVETTTVTDGAAALLELMAAKREKRSYDALLVDHFMKDMDGLELAIAARAQPNLSALPVILMASTSLPGRNRLERAGVTGFVVKPVRRLDLYNVMARCLGGVEVPGAICTPDEEAPQTLAPFHALVAEDNLVNQEVIQGMLEALGGRVTMVENGRRALEAFSETVFDVVLMDCQMPMLDGYDASRAIRQHEAARPGSRRVPIIALTAHALGDDRNKCLAAGMDDYLAKPTGMRELARVLGEHLPEKTVGPVPVEAASSEPPPPADLDREVLEKIRALGGGTSSAFLTKVLNTYLRTAPDLVERMREALAAGDATHLADAAHTLKSSSASVGADRLASLCRGLEKAGREGRLDQAPNLFSRLETEFSQIKIALSEEYLAKSA